LWISLRSVGDNKVEEFGVAPMFARRPLELLLDEVVLGESSDIEISDGPLSLPTAEKAKREENAMEAEFWAALRKYIEEL
jgi:hypothetical protein